MIDPFHVSVPQTALNDLRTRLANTRWTDEETVNDWSQGVPLKQLQTLCKYWRDGYNWRHCEAKLNSLGQFRTVIDGLGIHFLHIRSPEANALPLLVTHGWPGSVLEFLKVIGPLTEPVNHGGRAEHAFHLVIPSLPGYGLSDRPRTVGWGVRRIANSWIELMTRLGYARWVAQGGDWGAAVTTALGQIAPGGLAAIHLNMPLAFPEAKEMTALTAEEKLALNRLRQFRSSGGAYARQQATRPQTLGHALADSPVGQAAWILEKLQAWTDCDGHLEGALTRDEILDNISLYWLTNTGASSARLYWESFGKSFAELDPVTVPTGCSIFPKEIFQPSRRQVEKRYINLRYYNKVSKGGHFAAWEQPELFVEEMRRCFSAIGRA